MSIGHLLVYLVVALLCGLIAQALVRRSVGGFIVSTLVGLGGGVLGSYLASVVRVPDPLPLNLGGKTFPLLWTIAGAALLTMLLSLAQRGGRSLKPTGR